MADCSSILARLTKAQAAYDDMMNGEQVSRWVDQNGESVSYNSGAGALSRAAYLARLEAQYAACLNGGTQTAYRGPIKFTFGRRC